jgi:hypothetical protein
MQIIRLLLMIAIKLIGAFVQLALQSVGILILLLLD